VAPGRGRDIEGDVGPAGLENGQNRDDEVGAAREGEGDAAVAADPTPPEVVGQAIRLLVQLPVAPLPLAADEGE